MKRSSGIRRRAALTVIAGLASTQAGAQQRDSVAVSDSVRKSGTLIAPVIVSAGLNAVDRSLSGAATSIATSVAPSVGYDLTQFLRLVPGSHIDLATGPGGPAIVRLRGGEEVFTRVIADGVKINDNGGFFDMQGLNVGTFDRIEVVPGPQSAVHGSAALSGVVQLMSAPGIPGTRTLRGTFEGGSASSHGTNYRGSAAASGGSGRLGYSVAAEHAYDRGIYDIAHNSRTSSGFARLDFFAQSNVSVTGLVRYLRADSNVPVRDPGATRAPLDPDASNTRDRWITSLQARMERGRSVHTLRASHYDRKFIYDDLKNGIDPAAYPYFIFDANFNLKGLLDRTTLDYLGTTEVQVGGLEAVNVSYGALVERENLREITSGDFGDGDQSFSQNSGALFAEVQSRPLDRFVLLIGGRAEKFERVDVELVPRVAASFEVSPRASLRAAASRGFKAPDLRVVFVNNPFIESNPSLAPERSSSWEVGADMTNAVNSLSGSVTYFHQTFRDLIRSVPLEGTTKSINRNLGRSRASGIEGTIIYRPAPGWEAGANGGWTKTEITENTGLSPDQYPLGEELPFRPNHVANAFLRVPLAPRFAATLRAQSVGEQLVLTERFSGDRVTLPGHTIGGITGEFQITSRAFGYVRVDNVLDNDYMTAFDRPAASRSVVIGATIRQ